MGWVWIRFSWLRTRTSTEILCTRQWTFGSIKDREFIE
jgi:hypothetical protein